MKILIVDDQRSARKVLKDYLSSLADIECSIWKERCPGCGTTLWRTAEHEMFDCPRCGHGMKVLCPRTRRMDEISDVLRETFPETFAVGTG